MSPLTPQLLDVPTWPQSRLHDGARIGSTVSYSSGSLSPVMTQFHAGHVEPYAPMNAFGGSGDAVDAALARAASELGVGLRGSHGGHNERLVNRAMELMGVRPSGRSPLAPPQGMSPVQSSISHSCVPRPVSVAENRDASMGTGTREESLSPLGAAFSGKLTNPAPVKTATEAPESSCAVQPARSDSIGAVFSGCDSELLVRKGDGRDEREATGCLVNATSKSGVESTDVGTKESSACVIERKEQRESGGRTRRRRRTQKKCEGARSAGAVVSAGCCDVPRSVGDDGVAKEVLPSERRRVPRQASTAPESVSVVEDVRRCAPHACEMCVIVETTCREEAGEVKSYFEAARFLLRACCDSDDREKHVDSHRYACSGRVVLAFSRKQVAVGQHVVIEGDRGEDFGVVRVVVPARSCEQRECVEAMCDAES